MMKKSIKKMIEKFEKFSIKKLEMKINKSCLVPRHDSIFPLKTRFPLKDFYIPKCDSAEGYKNTLILLNIVAEKKDYLEEKLQVGIEKKDRHDLFITHHYGASLYFSISIYRKNKVENVLDILSRTPTIFDPKSWEYISLEKKKQYS